MGENTATIEKVYVPVIVIFTEDVLLRLEELELGLLLE